MLKNSEDELIEDIESGLRTEAVVNEIRKKSYETERIKLSYGNDVLYKVNVWVGTLKRGISLNRGIPFCYLKINIKI